LTGTSLRLERREGSGEIEGATGSRCNDRRPRGKTNQRYLTDRSKLVMTG